MTAVDPNTSLNFRAGKVAAILVVASGHFLQVNDHVLHQYGFWVAVTVALFIFGFSSGYFTSARYAENFSLRTFWRRKAFRLGPDFLVVNSFLLILFLIQGKSGVWTWQTALSVIGVKGFLTWFGAHNPSPFGAGLWFLTLLLIFYAGYPLLRLVGRSRLMTVIMAGGSLVGFTVLQHQAPMGHMLWLTAWSFLAGLGVQRLSFSIGALYSGALAGALACFMAVLNIWFKFESLNFYLIVGISITFALWMKDAKIPRWLLVPLVPLSGCLLEIYLLHPYLLVRGIEQTGLNVLLSLVCVVGISYLLNMVASGIRRFPGVKGGRLPIITADQAIRPLEERRPG